MESFILWGTIVNATAVIIGSVFGLLLKKLIGTAVRKKEKFDSTTDLIFKGLGLCTLLLGIMGSIKTGNILVVILSTVIGALIGALIDIDRHMVRLGDRIESRTKAKQGSISQGFVSGCLLFCIGAMTIVGSMNSGLSGDHTMLYSKSMLDLVASVILASTLGIGVMLSSLFVLVFQGSITLVAYFAGSALSETVLTSEVITEITAVGSVMIIGLAMNMIGITKIKVANFMPAILLPIGLVPLFNLF